MMQFSSIDNFLTANLRRHGLAYLFVNGALISINILTGPPSWSFWPFIGWCVLLTCHYFYVRSINVDPDWADQRAGDLRLRSYDVSHILEIDDRHDKKRERRKH